MQHEAEILKKLDELTETVEVIKTSLTGGVDGRRPGINGRVASLESTAALTNETAQANVKAIAANTTRLNTMESTLTTFRRIVWAVGLGALTAIGGALASFFNLAPPPAN